MQNVINSVKGTALGVAEYLTPVLKVRFRRNKQSWQQLKWLEFVFTSFVSKYNTQPRVQQNYLFLMTGIQI